MPDFLLSELSDQLCSVEARIVQSELNLTRQRIRVASMEQGGADAVVSRSLLDNIGRALKFRYRYRQTILRAIKAETAFETDDRYQ